MDAGSGSLMEAAPCGRAAAGRLKLQVERVMGCRRRSFSVLLCCSKKSPRLWPFFMKKEAETPCRHSVKFSWGEEIPADFTTEWHVIPAFSNSLLQSQLNYFLLWKTSLWCQRLHVTLNYMPESSFFFVFWYHVESKRFFLSVVITVAQR